MRYFDPFYIYNGIFENFCLSIYKNKIIFSEISKHKKIVAFEVNKKRVKSPVDSPSLFFLLKAEKFQLKISDYSFALIITGKWSDGNRPYCISLRTPYLFTVI